MSGRRAALVAILAAAAPAAAAMPPVAVEVRLASDEVGAGSEVDALAGRVAATLADWLEGERFAYLDWRAWGEAPEGVPRLVVSVEDGNLPCAAPLHVRLVAAIGGTEFAVSEPRELYEPCDPDPAFSRESLDQFELDLVAAVRALVQDEIEERVQADLLKKIPLTDRVEPESAVKVLKIPLRLSELKAKPDSTLGVSFTVPVAGDEADGEIKMSPKSETDDWTRCELSKFKFVAEEIDSNGWHDRLPALLEQATGLNVYMDEYFLDAAPGLAGSGIVLGGPGE